MDEPAGHRAVGDLAHANAWCGTTRRADRVRATLVASIESPTHGDRLSRQKVEFLAELVGHLERDRRRVGAQLVDSGDREVPEFAAKQAGTPCRPAPQISFRYSNGSPHDVQRYSARQAVAPNTDCRAVSGDAHRGQRTGWCRSDEGERDWAGRPHGYGMRWDDARSTEFLPTFLGNPVAGPGRARGWSAPRRRRIRRPPAGDEASLRITWSAGQPVYVGVIVTTACRPVTVTSRRMPRSATVSCGSSGSGTASAMRAGPRCRCLPRSPGRSGMGARQRSGARPARRVKVSRCPASPRRSSRRRPRRTAHAWPRKARRRAPHRTRRGSRSAERRHRRRRVGSRRPSR